MVIKRPSRRQLRWMLGGSLLLCASVWLWLTVSQHESTLAIRPVSRGVAMPDGFFPSGIILTPTASVFKSITPQKDGLLIKFDSNARGRRGKRSIGPGSASRLYYCSGG